MPGRARAPVTGPSTRASLVAATGGGSLQFHFNPEKVTVSKKASTEGARGLITNSFEDAVKAVGNLSIKLSDVHFTGTTTKTLCDLLIRWTTPAPVAGRGAGGAARAPRGATGATGGGLRGAVGGTTTSTSTTRTPSAARVGAPAGVIYKLPLLMFNWGGGGGSRGLSYRVVLEKVDISYRRFDPTGAPVWATVGMDLKEYAEDLPPTNPSSGGEGGRTKHLVTAGDNIVRIANDGYGTPHAWRVIAEVNRIDDPLRIKPGRILDLPGLTELPEAEEQS